MVQGTTSITQAGQSTSVALILLQSSILFQHSVVCAVLGALLLEHLDLQGGPQVGDKGSVAVGVSQQVSDRGFGLHHSAMGSTPTKTKTEGRSSRSTSMDHASTTERPRRRVASACILEIITPGTYLSASRGLLKPTSGLNLLLS